jgi:predicted NAD-dependent protein-ADP-ribosyltransferase YbiA (DUF1768 family)
VSHDALVHVIMGKFRRVVFDMTSLTQKNRFSTTTDDRVFHRVRAAAAARLASAAGARPSANAEPSWKPLQVYFLN